jgi:protein TonB
MAAAGESALRVTLQRRLQQELSRHFRYPLLARRRGWQGEVRLAFSLDQHGSIIHARVARGSGHRALDRAALEALGKVAAIDVDLSRELSFELPVIYKLSGG